MTHEWKDDRPIYRQLRDMVVERIMDGSFVEGEAIPSVRQVAADYQINHLTVAKAYQELVDLGLLQKRRGLGMYVPAGARTRLTLHEQLRFTEEELPAFIERVRALGLDLEEVIELMKKGWSES